MPDSKPANSPLILLIRDGWGQNPHSEHRAFNAVELASTPVADSLMREYPNTLIHPSGEDVGVPEGTTGNSEVGHQNIGAGRIVFQDSVRISNAICDGSFFRNESLLDACRAARTSAKRLHFLGIASDAGVHGRLEHLYACLELCKREGLKPGDVCIHLFTDGRDTGPFTGINYIAQVEAKIEEIGVGRITSIIGRYWAMDRDNRWERIKRAYDCLTGTDRSPVIASAKDAMQRFYDSPPDSALVGDEFMTPTIIAPDDATSKNTRIADGDSVIFYNYPRRPTAPTHPRVRPRPVQGRRQKPHPTLGVSGFDRPDKLNLHFVTMAEYESELNPYVNVAFPRPPELKNILGQYLSNLDLTQFRCAETEKYAHVTFFFNDYREKPFPGESRTIIQSPKVSTYDQQPEMSAAGVRDAVLNRLAADDCESLIVVNFANPDMVGHTGKLDAVIKAVEFVDCCVGTIVEATLARSGSLIVFADHGNAEQMFDPQTNGPHTAHTPYDVPLIIVGESFKGQSLRTGGRLADLAPTALDMLNLPIPNEMTGQSLIQ